MELSVNICVRSGACFSRRQNRNGSLELWNLGTLEPSNPETLEPWDLEIPEPSEPGALEPINLELSSVIPNASTMQGRISGTTPPEL